ncbi:hypothetical protein HG530_003836 [Fusarium avenaceum]|nr:hypothetical protein HG530_003836 [Fusarium avenaceum]
MYNLKVEHGDPNEFTMEIGGHRVTVPYLSPEEEKQRNDERAKLEGPVTGIPDDVNIEALRKDVVEASKQYLTVMNEINEQHGGGPDQVPDFTPALALVQAQVQAPVPALGPAWDPALARAQAPALAPAPAPVPTYQMGGISANRMPLVIQRHGAPGFGTDSPVLSRPHSCRPWSVNGNSSMASPAMNRSYSGSVTDKPINGCTVPGCPAYGSSVSKCPINGCFVRGCPANTHPASGCPVEKCPANRGHTNGYNANGYTANGHHTNGYPAIGCPVTGCAAAGSLMKRCRVNGCFIKGCPTNTHPARGCQFIGCPGNPSAKRYPA